MQYRVDVPAWATLYIEATSKAEAIEFAKGYAGAEITVSDGDIVIDGESDGQDEPNGSVLISPVATLGGSDDFIRAIIEGIEEA